MRHRTLLTDNLTYMRMLAQNDPLEWTRRIGGLQYPTTTLALALARSLALANVECWNPS